MVVSNAVLAKRNRKTVCLDLFLIFSQNGTTLKTLIWGEKLSGLRRRVKSKKVSGSNHTGCLYGLWEPAWLRGSWSTSGQMSNKTQRSRDKKYIPGGKLNHRNFGYSFWLFSTLPVWKVPLKISIFGKI